MNNYRGITYFIQNNYFITEGLYKLIKKEFKMRISHSKLEDYDKFFRYLIDYIIDNKPVIKQGNTIAYHSWILMFDYTSDNYLNILEANSSGERYLEGIEYAAKVITEQETICKQFEVTPIFPLFSQNIVISKGVYEGLPVNGVRYPSPNHMTGWWLTTDLYDDDINSLLNVHYYHVAFKRPEILKLLALPYGFRFFISESDVNVRFDNTVFED